MIKEITRLLVLGIILLVSGCDNSLSNEQKLAIIYGPNSTAPFPVKKDTFFKVEHLRSGAIKAERGWNVQDFAHSFFNPNSEEITVRLKMISDDPKFIFANGQIGTFTKTYDLKPIFGITDNVYICPVFEKYKPNWPVSAKTNFTGSVEFSSSKPFYYYLLHETPVGESTNIVDAYYNAWNPCEYDEGGVWDKELNQFIIPYTNYWHNTTNWIVGWYSTLVIRNNTNKSVIYTIRHIPFYGGQYNPENGLVTHFREQVVDLPLKQYEEKTISLMDLFGWYTNQTASMEGCLFIKPNHEEATQSGTTLSLQIIPNKSGKALHDAIP